VILESSLASYLRDAREQVRPKLSQSDAARKLEKKIGETVSISYINKLEQGKMGQPDIVRLKALCELYGCDFEVALQKGDYPGYTAPESRIERSPLLGQVDDTLASWSDMELQLLLIQLPHLKATIRDMTAVLVTPITGQSEQVRDNKVSVSHLSGTDDKVSDRLEVKIGAAGVKAQLPNARRPSQRTVREPNEITK
jgi:transcriptional regulator with XRE-family HTH domain